MAEDKKDIKISFCGYNKNTWVTKKEANIIGGNFHEQS